MSFGAAFYAANRSKYFRVRPIQFNDGFDFDVTMELFPLLEEEADVKVEKTSLSFLTYKETFDKQKNYTLPFNQNLQIDFK